MQGFLFQPENAIPTDYVLLFPARNGGRRIVRDTTRYEIFKDDPPRSPRWLEAVEGLEQAMNRIEELATHDPSSDYYLYSNPSGQAHKTFASYVTPPRRDAPRQVPEKDRLNIRSGTTSAIQHSQPGSYFPPSRLGCGRLRCHSLISFCNSLFLVSFVSVASCRSSSAIRPAAKSGRPDFFFGCSNRIAVTPLSLVSHEDADSGALSASCNSFCFYQYWQAPVVRPPYAARHLPAVPVPQSPDGSRSGETKSGTPF